MSDNEITITFKPNDQRELVNALREIAMTHGHTQSLRDKLSRRLAQFIRTHKQEETK